MTLEIPQELENRLRPLADQQGETLEAFALTQLEKLASIVSSHGANGHSAPETREERRARINAAIDEAQAAFAPLMHGGDAVAQMDAEKRLNAELDEKVFGTPNTPSTRAREILSDIRSGDIRRRNAAISRSARGDAQTRQIVESELEKSNAAYDGPEDDLSDWRALGGAPVFPDEAPDYLDGLYRADDAEKESV